MEIFTNSKDVKKFIHPSIKVHSFNSLLQDQFIKSSFLPLLILTSDFIDLSRTAVPYHCRKKPYDLVVLYDNSSNCLQHLINFDVLALLKYPLIQFDIDLIIERYEFRRSFIQNKDFSNSILKVNSGKYILTNDIKFIRAYGNYTLIFTEKERIMERSTMAQISNRLPNKTFIQTHRSYVVNINTITEIKLRSLKIKNDTIPISSRKKSEVLKLLENQNMIV